MPDIPIFLDYKDLAEASELLSDDPEIAIIHSPSQKPEKKLWQAFSKISLQDGNSYCLWHIPSGPVVMPGEHRRDPDWVEVSDPFGGWEAFPYNNDWQLPNVGDKPQFFSLRVVVVDPRNKGLLGLSHFSWIGSRYEKAPNEATKWWRSLRSRIKKRSKPVFGNGINTDAHSKFECWPAAYDRIRPGA